MILPFTAPSGWFPGEFPIRAIVAESGEKMGNEG